MNLVTVLTAYLNFNILILIGCLGLFAITWGLKKFSIALPAQTELKLHYSILGLVIVFSLIQPLLPNSEIFSPAAKVWAAQSLKNIGAANLNFEPGGYLSLSDKPGAIAVLADKVSVAWLFVTVILFGFGLIRITREIGMLSRIRKSAFLVRRIGSVNLRVSSSIRVPFSFWIPGENNVVVPEAMLQNRRDFHFAIAHELQHHRQGDTRWTYIIWFLKIAAMINPVIYFWSRWISEVQEFACDEILVGHHNVDSHAYARCLVEVAQSAMDQKFVPVCATGLTFLIERNLLKRRIEKMLNNDFKETKFSNGRPWAAGLAVGLAMVMSWSAYASKGLVQDRRVSMERAEEMAARIKSEDGFPIIVNESVLRQLNRYIGTPEGRDFMRVSLQRMKNHEMLVGGYLHRYGIPKAVMAVPIIESGYQNLAEKNQVGWGAGIWMFIKATARNYGLRVDSAVDERLNIELLTDAAMRYFQGNYLRFKDWHLAILAYNIGEKRVQSAIEKLGTRDAWVLIQNGFENDKDYLPKVMAAILIMNNPESVN